MSISTFSWPDWVELKVLDHGTTVQITVTHGLEHYRWHMPRGSAASRDTLRIAISVKRGLIERQAAIDEVTERLQT